MPEIRVQCECGKGLRLSADQAGRKGRCPQCGRVVLVPVASAFEAHPTDRDNASNHAAPQQPRLPYLEVRSGKTGEVTTCESVDVLAQRLSEGVYSRRDEARWIGEPPETQGPFKDHLSGKFWRPVKQYLRTQQKPERTEKTGTCSVCGRTRRKSALDRRKVCTTCRNREQHDVANDRTCIDCGWIIHPGEEECPICGSQRVHGPRSRSWMDRLADRVRRASWLIAPRQVRIRLMLKTTGFGRHVHRYRVDGNCYYCKKTAADPRSFYFAMNRSAVHHHESFKRDGVIYERKSFIGTRFESESAPRCAQCAARHLRLRRARFVGPFACLLTGVIGALLLYANYQVAAWIVAASAVVLCVVWLSVLRQLPQETGGVPPDADTSGWMCENQMCGYSVEIWAFWMPLLLVSLYAAVGACWYLSTGELLWPFSLLESSRGAATP